MLVVAGLTLTGCGTALTVTATSTPRTTQSVAVPATPSPTSAPTPTPFPTPTPTAVRTPAPTLDATASADLQQVYGLATSADDYLLFRTNCADLQSPSDASYCKFLVNREAGAAQGLPQAIQGLIGSYNLDPGISGLILSEFQQGLRDLQSGVDGELAGVQDLSGSEVLSAASDVDSGANGIETALRDIQ